jgi:hypothetical protein
MEIVRVNEMGKVIERIHLGRVIERIRLGRVIKRNLRWKE